jgi:carbon storage regulator
LKESVNSRRVNMLVFSRKCGQTVRIGDDITLTFLGVRGNAAKIGIDAPSLVKILRGELTMNSESLGAVRCERPPPLLPS